MAQTYDSGASVLINEGWVHYIIGSFNKTLPFISERKFIIYPWTKVIFHTSFLIDGVFFSYTETRGTTAEGGYTTINNLVSFDVVEDKPDDSKIKLMCMGDKTYRNGRYVPQSYVCDSFMKEWCVKNPTHGDCTCLTASAKSGEPINPICFSTACINGGYRTNNMGLLQCPSIITCNQINNIKSTGAIQLASGIQVEQGCGNNTNVTRTDVPAVVEPEPSLFDIQTIIIILVVVLTITFMGIGAAYSAGIMGGRASRNQHSSARLGVFEKT